MTYMKRGPNWPQDSDDWSQKACWDIAESIRGDPDGFTNTLNTLDLGVFELERVMHKGGYKLCTQCDCWYETENFSPSDPAIENSEKLCTGCNEENGVPAP